MSDEEHEETPPPPPPQNGNRQDNMQSGPVKRGVLTWVTVSMMALFIFFAFAKGDGNGKELPNEGTFRELVRKGQVEKCEIVREISGKTYVKGIRKGSDKDENGIPKAFTVSVMPETENLRSFLSEHDIYPKISYPSQFWGSLFQQIFPTLIFVLIFYFLFIRPMRGNMNAMNFGKSRAHKQESTKARITFKDVAGADEAKQEVAEIVEFLKDPRKFARLGGRMPKGALLMGPPGTGKTLLARAIAGEAGVPFFSISGSDFIEMFVGVGASRVRDMFEQGKKNAPCIIFIDEIDAVGRSRFTGIGGGHDEREQTLNAMLVEMDGFEATSGVIVMAATNRPDVLDKALLRPGRFDRQIVIDLPTMEGRQAILGVHAQKIKLAPTVQLERIARGTPGFSGADLANLINEAALIAARLNKDAVDQSDLEEARDKVCWGRERPGQMKDLEEKRITAVHEAGHAIVMSHVKGGEPVHKVTIIPRGMALGATMFLPKKDRVHYSRTRMLANLTVAMGGRVAEELFLDDISTGASQDLHQATDLAHRMVCDWGMSEKLGPRTFGTREEMMFLGREVGRTQDYSESTAKIIDAEVNRLVNDAYELAKEILSKHKQEVDLLVDALLEYETVDGADVESIVKDKALPPRPARQAANGSPKEDGSEKPSGTDSTNVAEDPLQTDRKSGEVAKSGENAPAVNSADDVSNTDNADCAATPKER